MQLIVYQPNEGSIPFNVANLRVNEMSERNTLQSAFSMIYGEFSEEENNYINEVLKGVKERSEGSVHISFDFEVLIKDKNDGKSVEDILDKVFSIIGKVESGEIKSKPLSFDDSQKRGWCGKNCECYPDPATESEEDKITRLVREAYVDEVLKKRELL